LPIEVGIWALVPRLPYTYVDRERLSTVMEQLSHPNGLSSAGSRVIYERYGRARDESD